MIWDDLGKYLGEIAPRFGPLTPAEVERRKQAVRDHGVSDYSELRALWEKGDA